MCSQIDHSSLISDLPSIVANVALASGSIITPNAIDIKSYGIGMPLAVHIKTSRIFSSFGTILEEFRGCKPIILPQSISVSNPPSIYVPGLDFKLCSNSTYYSSCNYNQCQSPLQSRIPSFFLRGIGSLPLKMLVKIVVRTIIGP
jgi:hypothetical protein